MRDKRIGKTVYSSVYGKTYAEVRLKRLEHVAGQLNKSRSKSTKTFMDVLYLWAKQNKTNHKGATEAKYESLITAHIENELGGRKITEITAALLNDYANRKLKSGRLDGKGGLSPSYVRTIMIIVSSVMKYAAAEGFCQPIKSIIYKPVPEKKDLEILSVTEQRKYEDFLFGNPTLTNLGILISLYMGLRIGEVCALSWENVDMAQRIIHVRSTVTRIKNTEGYGHAKTILAIGRPKTEASSRDIPIPSKLFPMLLKMKENAGSTFVISDQNSFVKPRTYEYRYHRTLEKCSIAPINYHALRHTFATRCIEVGVDVKTLSELLGHADVSITLNTYVHPSMQLKRNQIEKLCV